METVYDRLVRGAVDLHCHIDVEFSTTLFRKAAPEWEWLPHAERAGMRAVSLKSHLWPTVSALPFIKELYKGPVQVHGSITLNPLAGGLDPFAVEAAVHMGARAVFLPTWGSRNDYVRGGFGRRLDAAFEHFDGARLGTLSLVDDDGGLTAPAHEILRLARHHDVMLSTGHSSPREALAVAEEAHRIGYERVVFGHPLSNSVGASRELVHRAAGLGAFVEFCWPTVSPGRHDPAEVVSLIQEVGAARTVLTSDFFGGNNPLPADLLRVFLGVLHDAGLSEDDVRLAAATNPARLLGV
ncbi:DUF6282 family protein [Streptomyces sp. NPDC050560]|uniref:DUF6282 family protein n=1 Tax=Streptomyces sp. NPDC050560 TaxID=3365630 RepID=UPI00378E48C9